MNRYLYILWLLVLFLIGMGLPTKAAETETIIPTESIVYTESAETIEETTPIIEVVETIDYTQYLEQICGGVATITESAVYILGISLFFAVVCLCYFVYKFFRIFF